ncbi:Putative AC9 transposase [Gossypium arboreum]|uniref:Putative AC9 transposase n=1 Tax=Gossypium arboreum TaxID=29729 RepID=A0A0B0N0I0_GOSAR|nr:Putative AC9 transposase [Gossypium arboreum]
MERDLYLREPLLSIAADILSWWRVNSQKFPTLTKMARDQLAMPVSISAPRLDISVMTTNPANLNPEGMEALDKRKWKIIINMIPTKIIQHYVAVEPHA